LEQYNYQYFVDESNHDEKYERNYFRKHFSDRLIKEYQSGILKSFDYLRKDKEALLGAYREIFHHKAFYILEIQNSQNRVRIIDKYLKKLGYLLSSKQRGELNHETSMVVGGVWSVEIVDHRVYIAPYLKPIMPKQFKEHCRVARVPSKIRGYLYKERLDPKKVLPLD
jgi:tRNA(Ile)-lysidine synthase